MTTEQPIFAVRNVTEALARPLAVEDYVVQSMADASPTKWHLGHTTWFLEEFILPRLVDGYTPRNPAFRYLFNSYYESIGQRHPRAQRGLLTRPTVEETYAYRHAVDDALRSAISRADESVRDALTLALHHEQQHQELLLTDIKHALATQPLRPAYLPQTQEMESSKVEAQKLGWCAFEGGVQSIGHEGNAFSFDNESPRHQVFCAPFELSSRLVTNGEYLEFVRDGGYARADLWLSEGWSLLATEGIRAPLYWRLERDGQWVSYELVGGEAPLDPHAPVTHVSYFEADAYARWCGARLPTEAEWEVAASRSPVNGTFLESPRKRPAISSVHHNVNTADPHCTQLFGEAWQWTGSSYLAYPGFRPFAGSFGEYNGKFMSGQMVLRGGSCFTPRSHIRASYRNFFPPTARWQVSGIRLGRDR